MAQSMADSFGARIETRTSDGIALCLVIGDTEPMNAIAAVDGTPVGLLGNGRVLALVALNSLPTLRAQPSVRHAGPVNVDRARLADFARLTGNTLTQTPGPQT
jgi:hypothetical protein